MPIDFDKMKEGLKRSLEKGLETAKDGLDIATEKSAKFIEVQKIKSQISGLNQNIKQSYNDLGRKVYGLKDTELGQMPELKAFIDEITRMYSEIEACKVQIERVKAASPEDFANIEIIEEDENDQYPGR